MRWGASSLLSLKNLWVLQRGFWVSAPGEMNSPSPTGSGLLKEKWIAIRYPENGGWTFKASPEGEVHTAWTFFAAPAVGVRRVSISRASRFPNTRLASFGAAGVQQHLDRAARSGNRRVDDSEHVPPGGLVGG